MKLHPFHPPLTLDGGGGGVNKICLGPERPLRPFHVWACQFGIELREQQTQNIRKNDQKNRTFEAVKGVKGGLKEQIQNIIKNDP